MQTLGILLAIQLLAADRIELGQAAERLAGLEIEVEQWGGRRIKGSFVSATTEVITIKGSKSVDSIQRSSIVSIRTHRRQVRRRTIGLLAGYMGSGAVIGEAAQGPLAFVILGAGTLGFFLGRELDRDTHAIELY